MWKLGVMGLAASGLVGSFLFGRDATSYLRTGFRNVRNAVKAEVPLEFEMERARNIVEQLIPDIRNCMHVVAEQQVETENQRVEIAQREATAAKQREAILSMRTDLTSGKDTLVYANHIYSLDEVKRDLAARFERLKAAEETLSADRQVLKAREQSLAANRQKLESMVQAKKDLEVKLEQLQARIHTVKAAETISRLAIDDSNLSHANKLITDLNKQLDVKQKMLDVEGKFVGLIPVEKASQSVPADLDKQIDDYFGHTSANPNGPKSQF